MARELKSNVEGVTLSVTAAVIMTGTTARRSTNIWLTLHNGSATTDRTVTIYRVPSGDTRGDEHIIEVITVLYGGVAVPPSVVNHVLEAGDTIDMKVDAGTDCYVNGSITEISN